jgi:hypothetical protein
MKSKVIGPPSRNLEMIDKPMPTTDLRAAEQHAQTSRLVLSMTLQ